MTVVEKFDDRELRNVLGRFFTGVTVVTTVDATGKFWGVTANSFSSVSLEPPLVLWNQALTSISHPVFRQAERFAINILTEDQVALSQRFSRPLDDRFEGVEVTEGLAGVPLLEGCCAVLECRKVATHDEGDHAIFIGQVERVRCNEQRPLLFGDGQYMGAQLFKAAV